MQSNPVVSELHHLNSYGTILLLRVRTFRGELYLVEMEKPDDLEFLLSTLESIKHPLLGENTFSLVSTLPGSQGNLWPEIST